MFKALKNYFIENIDAICVGFANINCEDYLPYNN